jgi:hypothetical protein
LAPPGPYFRPLAAPPSPLIHSVPRMKGLIALALISTAAVPAAAHAAAKAGSYSGTTSGKYIQVGGATEPTDKGKVTFSVKGSKVENFKVRGQLFNCGLPPAQLELTVKTIKLNASGKGSATHKDQLVGSLKVSISVSSKGSASGTIVRPKSAAGLCNPESPVKFTAKRK